MSLAKVGLADSFPDLTREDFEYFRSVIFELSGISLNSSKRELVKSRLRSYLLSLRMQSYTDYRDYLAKLSAGDPEWQKFINFFTTNKTDFFREPQHFDFLQRTVIPNWLKTKNCGELKVWCCASSTGQEPYTLSMVLNRALPNSVNYRVLATDIDTEVLQKANNGVYPLSKLSEIPKDYQNEFVDLGKGNVSNWFRITDPIREQVVFKQHNLIESTYPGDEVFDVVFCRNVLIYFSPDTIRTLMQKLNRSLKKGGLLFISHSESISKCSDIFTMVKPSVYQKAMSDD